MAARRLAQAAFVAAFALLGAAGCKSAHNTRPYREPPPPDVKPTVIQYVESAGFDSLFETALVNADPVILVRTSTSKPDWGPRLNAWLAAWNMGGRVAGGGSRRTIRSQAPLSPLNVNGETIREFRLLVDDLMGKVERLAREGAGWWAEERTRSRRVTLLRPYNLRFHLDEDGNIQLIFFNGNYAESYGDFTQRLAAVSDEEEPGRWARVVTCSHCKRLLRRADRTADVVIDLAKADAGGP